MAQCPYCWQEKKFLQPKCHHCLSEISYYDQIVFLIVQTLMSFVSLGVAIFLFWLLLKIFGM